MLELERTFLAKSLPAGLKECRNKEIVALYVPNSSELAKLRIRNVGDFCEITKKEMLRGNDSSEQEEHTIHLTKEEYAVLSKLPGKRFRKIRYYCSHEGRTAEIDVYQDNLNGLVLIDFEFKTREEKDAFEMPDFCLAEVTQSKEFAGGFMAGRTYEQMEAYLKKYGYKKLFL